MGGFSCIPPTLIFVAPSILFCFTNQGLVAFVHFIDTLPPISYLHVGLDLTLQVQQG